MGRTALPCVCSLPALAQLMSLGKPLKALPVLVTQELGVLGRDGTLTTKNNE